MRTATSLAALTLLVAPTLSAQAVVGMEPTRDNTLYQSATGHLSNALGSRFFAGTTGSGDVRRGLLAFDIAMQIPQGSQILAVQLTLLAETTAQSTPQPVSLHRVLRRWTQGTSTAPGGQGVGGPATTGDATWLHTSYPLSRWQNAGGDFAAGASGTTPVGGPGSYTFATTTGLVADVQFWLDNPASDYGWMVLTNETTSQTAKGFGSKDEGSRTKRPRLLVTYAPPAGTFSHGAGCIGSAGNRFQLAASGSPTVPSPGFRLDLSGGPVGFRLLAATPGLLTTPVTLSRSCRLYVDPAAMILLSLGTATSRTLPIPNRPSLLGAELMFQGAVPETNGDLVTSNALQVRIGL